MSGARSDCARRRTTRGIGAGSISTTSGAALSASRARLSIAFESITNARSTVNSPSSRPRRMSSGRVEMIPSAPQHWRKSTAISRGASPATRSAWTTARRFAACTRAISSPMFRISPHSRNTTPPSARSAAGSSSGVLTAGITGVFSSVVTSAWRIGQPSVSVDI